MVKTCSQCSEKAVAKVKLETGQVVLMCRTCVDVAKQKRAGTPKPSTAAPPSPAPSPSPLPSVNTISTSSSSPPSAPVARPQGSIVATNSGNINSGNNDTIKLKKQVQTLSAKVDTLTRERDDAHTKLSEALELMREEERKLQSSQTMGTVRRAAQRAAVAEEQAVTLQTELEAAVAKNAALTKQLSSTCDRLTDIEDQLARAGAGVARSTSSDVTALEARLAEARAAREHVEAERDALQAEYDKATDTARKRLEFAAQLVVELEQKVEDLSSDLADKETQVALLKDELELAHVASAKRRQKEKKSSRNDDDDDDDDDDAIPRDDDGVNLDAVPVLFGAATSTTASVQPLKSVSSATDDSAESLLSPTGLAAAQNEAAVWRIRAERAEADCVELRARLQKTEERLDAVQDRLVALMTEKSSDGPSVSASVPVPAAPVVAAPGAPPPAPPPMPSAPMKGGTPLKIGPKTDASRTALARANNAGMDSIFEQIKSGGVALRKVKSTDKREKPAGSVFDQMVKQIKAKNYHIAKPVEKSADGRMRFKEPPKSVRPPDVNEKRVLRDPRTGKPLGEDVVIGGDEPTKVAASPVIPRASASPTPVARSSPVPQRAASNVIEIEDDDDDLEEIDSSIDLSSLNAPIDD